MAFPANKLLVWQQNDIAQTSCSTKPNTDHFLQFALEVSPINGNKTKRVFYLKRPYDDPFSGFKSRLRHKISEFLGVQDELPVQPIYSGDQSPAEAIDDVSLFDLFFNATEPCSLSALRIGTTDYEIVRDSAWLDNVDISLLPLVGCPVLPSCDWKYATTKVQFHWFVASDRLPLRMSRGGGHSLTDRVRLEPAEWTHVHTGPYYSPTIDNVGKFLAVVVDFDDDGILVGTVCQKPIAKLGNGKPKNDQEEEEETIFERRQKECCAKQTSAQSYRLISYNILANLYLNLKKLEQKDLFFPYCPKCFLEANYRYPLILRELEGYNADLMFLQEVDFRLQKRFLIQFLHFKNYSSVFNCKGNEVNEGLLIAFRNDRFHSLAESDGDNFTVKLSQFLEEDTENSDIRTYLRHREMLREKITSRPTILQLVRLRAKHGGQQLLCANTHLYYDPKYEEVKIIQTLLCLRYIDKIRAQLSNDSSCQIQVIFAGDFNSTPESRPIALIGGDDQILEMKPDEQNYETNAESLLVKAPFKSQLLSGSSEYTNFTRPPGSSLGFNGCLDYIWAHPPLRIEHIWPMPDHRLVTKYDALPSPIAPSDHLPILCDVQLDSDEVGSEDNARKH
ncbi:hypothetical protein niasHS_014561 [Heterodera schachtii]|uniref:Endonuclease/exonuclease/phosphatase domain-containing protein n=1 Tax=Heterodera schachtii TaxID=97005 RepID=A0ABD2IEZ3_HETSC